MGGSCLANLAYVAAAGRPALPWAVILPGVFTCGLAMSVPAMTLRILARVPELSGTAASVLGFMQMLVFSLVSGWCVPLVYGQPLRLALAMLACVAASALGWTWLQAAAAGQRRAGLTGRRATPPDRTRIAIRPFLPPGRGGIWHMDRVIRHTSPYVKSIILITRFFRSARCLFRRSSLPCRPLCPRPPRCRAGRALTHAIQTALLCSALAHQNATAQVAAETPSAPGDVVQMPAVTVTGANLGGATEGTNSYTTEAMSTATGLTLAPRETPQSVSVVTRQQIEDRACATPAILRRRPASR